MKKIIIIPARYDSVRLPGKPLAMIQGKPMIHRVVEQCLKVTGIDRVIVATDNAKIMDVASLAGAEAIGTSCRHKSGSDRVAEVARFFEDDDLIINVQGDMPFINPLLVQELIAFMQLHNCRYDILTPGLIKTGDEWLSDYCKVKVTHEFNIAKCFSRKLPPVIGDGTCLRHHLGIYLYQNWSLQRFARRPPTEDELEQGLEQLRAMGNNFLIGVMDTDYDCGLEINTPEDLVKANDGCYPESHETCEQCKSCGK